MKDKWLDASEYQKAGVFSSRINYDTAMFPFEYPLLNHPSTILLIKAPFGPKEAESIAPDRLIKMNDRYEFLPSFSTMCIQERSGALSCRADLPLVEVQVSVG